MSGREAFEAWAQEWSALEDSAERRQFTKLSGRRDRYAFGLVASMWDAWSARDAEIAAKDARIADLEAALRKIKGLPRFEQYEEGPSYGYQSPDGAWLVCDDVDDIIEEALR